MPFSVEVRHNITNHETAREGYEKWMTSHCWFEEEGPALAFAQREANRLGRPTRYRWCHTEWRERVKPGGTGPYVDVQPERENEK